MDAFTHLPENASKKLFEVIQVELKSQLGTIGFVRR